MRALILLIDPCQSRIESASEAFVVHLQYPTSYEVVLSRAIDVAGLLRCARTGRGAEESNEYLQIAGKSFILAAVVYHIGAANAGAFEYLSV